MVPRRAVPLWLLLSLAVVAAVCLRCLGAAGTGNAGGGGESPQFQLAFLGFLVTLGGWILHGLSAAARVSVAALAWSVKALWLFATKTHNGLLSLGRGVLTGLQKAWRFFELTYERVLKPAWGKFWSWFDKFRRWLDATVGPVLEFLRDVRDGILDFWKTYVRPWLDVIDVTRRLLRVLGSLGLQWARELDRKLAELESKIERPLRLVIAELNQIIGVVNRVITANGLIQKVSNIRSLSRDVREAWRLAVNWRHREVTAEEWDEARKEIRRFTSKEITADARRTIEAGDGRFGALTSEMVATWTRELTSPDTF